MNSKVDVTDDPIVAEVRQARDDYAKRFNYDLDGVPNPAPQPPSRFWFSTSHLAPRTADSSDIRPNA